MTPPARGTTPVPQYDPATVIDTFSALRLDEAIPPDPASMPQHTDPIPHAGTSVPTQLGRRGPSLPVSPNQGLTTRSPPPQDLAYPNPPYDDFISYRSGRESQPNGDQFGAHTAHPYWNDSAVDPSASHNAIEPSSQYHQSPPSQAYFQQREYPKDAPINHL